MKIGLKIYSTDTFLISEALKLREDTFFDYIELYIIPDSYEKTIKSWKNIKMNCPFVIHAPHSLHGVNFAQVDMWLTNKCRFEEARLFAKDLDADFIIVHGGNNGSFDETLRQLSLLNEKRIVLENKPKFGLQNGIICNGWSPVEFSQAFSTGIIKGMILDFGHAVCAANSLGIDPMEIIGEFIAFSPVGYHISDGDMTSERDLHYNLGKGNFALDKFLSVLPVDAFVTIETPRDHAGGLEDFRKDMDFLSKLILKKS